MPRLLSVAILLIAAFCLIDAKFTDRGVTSLLSDNEIANYVLSAMNLTVDPCDDFYEFSCGTWIATTPLPPSKSSYPRNIGQISENNAQILIEICANPNNGKVYEFNTACMDTTTIENLGITPVQPLLAIANSAKDVNSLMYAVGQLHTYGISPLFSFYVDLDANTPFFDIGQMAQGGTSLPQSLYLGNSTSTKAIQLAYLEHVTTILKLGGASDSTAQSQANTIFKIESTLASFQLPPDEMTDPFSLYNKLDLSGLQSLAPDLPWQQFLNGLGYPQATQLNVDVPSFFQSMSIYIAGLNPSDWVAYLTWKTLNGASPYLTKAFVEADFNFYGKLLSGLSELPPRNTTCSKTTDQALGDQTGTMFAELTFGKKSKLAVDQMIQAIESQMKIDLLSLDWMDQTTREKALAKLKLIKNQIGYPENPDNYTSLAVNSSTYFQNVMNARVYSFNKDAARIGKLADRDQWFMTADTVNAYYDPTRNEMVFPAGILQFPYFNLSLPWAMNYAGAGVIMGHENTHGFDNQGKDYNGWGKLIDWWETETEIKFEDKVQCVVDQYNQYEVLPGLYVNGKLTENENIADIGGVKNSFGAYKNLIGNDANSPSVVPGFSNIQLFFIAYAQGWCQVQTNQYLQNQVATNVHSPAKYRVIGPLQDLEEFGGIFNCPAGSYMNPVKKCEVW